MSTSRIPLRIAVVQFAPKIGQIQANLTRARDLCRQLKPRSVDLVCFPEMILSGYVFENAAHISPYLELPRAGPTSQFCSELAEHLKCYVFAGYPERLLGDEAPEERSEPPRDISGPDTAESSEDKSDSQDGVHVVGANSAVLYGPGGEWVGNYRKTNLFVTDKTWAKAGTGFATFHLPLPLRTISLGICNDLNVDDVHYPAPWTLENGPYEIADYALSQQANVLVLLNAWLDSDKETEEEADWHTSNYWAARLRPLWVKDPQNSELDDLEGDLDDGSRDRADEHSGRGREMIVVVCNRSGQENGKTFAGSSAIYSMQQGAGRPKLLDTMGRLEEGVRIWDILV